MQDFLYLKFLDRIKGIISAVGVDYPVMRRILQVKLVINSRRSATILSREQTERKNSYLTSLAIYAFMGIFIGLLLLLPSPLFLKMSIVIGMILFLLLTTMISDFSSVLLDVQDRTILLTRPVSVKTLNAAKLLYILYYLAGITLSLAGVSLMVGLIKYGIWFFLTMFYILILICCFSLLFTAIFYFAILHLFSGEKLRDIINYFQIILTVFMTVVFQLVGRMFNLIDLNVQIDFHWWSYLLPSSWFAAPFVILFSDERRAVYFLLSAIGIIVPILALILYIKAAAPAFERNLQKLTSAGGGRTKGLSGLHKISALLCPNHDERVFFEFACSMLKSERKLKLRLFPSLTLGVIMPFIMLLSMLHAAMTISDFLQTVLAGKYYLYAYFSVVIYSTLFLTISRSESYRGAWIYRAISIDNPGLVFRGAMKAFLYKYVVPFYLLTCVIFTVLWGIKIIPDLLIIFMNLISVMLFVFLRSRKELPFSQNFHINQGEGSLGVVFLSILLCGCMVAAHYLLATRLSYGLVLNFGISTVLTVFLWHRCFRIGWDQIVRDAG
ncbi:MAG: ABC transporter permease [Lawsonibacter sp.]|nr:ABC transporter permease [Lawsonibacter sp.]